MRKIIVPLLVFTINLSFGQTNGVWRTDSGNTLYHHFTRSGGGAAVYINQTLTGNGLPILRLSSGNENPNANVSLRLKTMAALELELPLLRPD